ncbi:YafY family transcriptional regulator [Salmonella enterica subsp. enterica serovar Heidelberg]|nr:DNA-binding transcriptional regulator [Salmonella enterica subsp. enterica serovar Heidelberg]EIZ3895954.1 YafY family transcriptional regulator [Salmonella enterica subsp. enterica serovar Heidelberg]
MTRRADRLFQIVQILRGRRLTTAALLAQRLAVSERTIYRDIRDLSLSGVPVEGEAGSGYRLMAGFDLPPLMLTHRESEALMVAIRLLKTWGGDSLSRELESAQEKVLAILPEESRHYRDEAGHLSSRDIQPLGLFFWGEHWLLVAWCERREDYRCFRLDRCLQITPLNRRFRETIDRSLRDFLRKVEHEKMP